MQQYGSKCFARRLPPPPLTLGMGSEAFSEQCHVAYQIKGKQRCSSNMVANIFPAAPPPPPPPPQKKKKGKNQLFQNMVILHIKFKEITNAAQHGSKYIYRQTLRPLPGGSKGQNLTYSEHGHAAYQIKGNGTLSTMQALYSLLTHILNLLVGLKGKKTI